MEKDNNWEERSQWLVGQLKKRLLNQSTPKLELPPWGPVKSLLFKLFTPPPPGFVSFVLGCKLESCDATYGVTHGMPSELALGEESGDEKLDTNKRPAPHLGARFETVGKMP
ncbi:hypothetical protein BgiBS90_017190 [Biomphalaria glabrata]|nr:hypothetical protein BgiBS90_017190 [Biomphalaria glabrata]